MTKILLASNNAHKMEEIQDVLQLPTVELVLPKDAGISPEFDVDETGLTFEENAELKARAYAAQANMTTLADDSGLVVDALGGKPGIHSKRFILGSDHDRNMEILRLLGEQNNRAAYFITVLCLYDPERDEAKFFEGRVNGQIATQERGSAGFGYDPLFIPDDYDQTFGELGQTLKNELSHRARAVFKLREFLQNH